MRYRRIAKTDVDVSEVGFGVWTVSVGWWGDYSDDEAASLLRRALDRGVTFVPGAVFGVERPDAEALRLSFSTLAPDELRTGVRRLAAAVSALST